MAKIAATATIATPMYGSQHASLLVSKIRNEMFNNSWNKDILMVGLPKSERKRIGHIWVRFRHRVGHIKPRDLAGALKEERKASGG